MPEYKQVKLVKVQLADELAFTASWKRKLESARSLGGCELPAGTRLLQMARFKKDGREARKRRSAAPTRGHFSNSSPR